jgi:hypothetical protein
MRPRSVPISQALYEGLKEEVPFVICSAAFRKEIDHNLINNMDV